MGIILDLSTYLIELNKEYPGIIKIHDKLLRGETLDNQDQELINELFRETGWSIEDLIDEIKNLYLLRFETYQNSLKNTMKGQRNLKRKRIISKQEKNFGEQLQP